MTDPAITARSLSKTYRLYRKPSHRFVERLPWVHEPRHKAVHALDDVSFDIEPGSCVGLIGANGAGKSTLLKILAGTSYPTNGHCTIRGRIASLLELGAGFNPSFTGRENVFMNSALMGFTYKEAKERFKQVLEFSELGDFIYAPVRTYSSGMNARLGFSVAVATDPDVLIIDEILAVGDMHFRRKCVDRIMEFRARGKTMFFCSHSLYDVRQICDQAIWMKDGKVRLHADSVTVTNEYVTYENQRSEAPELTPWDELDEQPRAVPGRDPDDHARIVDAYLIDPKTGDRRHVFGPRETVGVRVHVKNGRVHDPLAVVVGFTRADGIIVFAPGTEIDGVGLDFSEGVVTLILPDLRLLSGEFIVPVWLLDAKGVHRFDEQPCKQNLIVQNRDRELGVFYVERDWQIEVIEPAPQKERST